MVTREVDGERSLFHRGLSVSKEFDAGAVAHKSRNLFRCEEGARIVWADTYGKRRWERQIP